jgi:RHS repeat-associated protein
MTNRLGEATTLTYNTVGQVSEKRAGTTSYLHGGLKNQSRQTNSSQTTTATRTYDAFGNVTSSSGTWNGPFGNAGAFGYQEDATGLKLLGHRYYDSSLGRFITRDPIKDGRNWYAYCGNDPVKGVDPRGLDLIVIVRGESDNLGDDLGDLAAAELFAAQMRKEGHEVVIIDHETPMDEQRDLITRADGIIFIGHGSSAYGKEEKWRPGSGRFKSGGERFDADWVKSRRAGWKLKRLKFVFIFSCKVFAGKDGDKTASTWAEVTEKVIGYCVSVNLFGGQKPKSFPLALPPNKKPTPPKYLPSIKDEKGKDRRKGVPNRP